MPVALTIRDGVAIVTIDYPPVNALGPASLPPVIDALDAADADASVIAIVLVGANGTFSGGADMKAFGAGPPQRPHTRDLIARIDAASTPIVAAIAGTAFGGGLEVALACDYRIAAPDARLALPETRRGLIPGAGGTQRLPRLIGVGPALACIVSGEPVDARAALACGLVDAMCDGDVIGAAADFARARAAFGRRRISSAPAAIDDAAIDAARKRAQPAQRGGAAEREAIDAVRDSTRLELTEGLARERSRFLALLDSEQSKARIHLFFAEREAGKGDDGGAPSAYRVSSVAVIGSGTMGTGIAMAFANAGVAVTLIDVRTELLDAARERIAERYAASVRKGRIDDAQRDERMGRIATAAELGAAAGAECIVEAVFEEMALKQDVFRKLDAIADPHAILASNTSTLDIDAIAAVTTRPQDVVGLHFFSPANVMRLLEIVRGRATSAHAIARAQGIAKQLGKVGVVAGNAEGFIGNRMLEGYLREANFLLEEGATPQQVDRVIRAFGFPMGPFAMSDLAGLDVGWRIRKGKHALAPPVGRYSRIGDSLCEAGRFGQKTGLGYYRYRDGDRTPIPDPEVDDLVTRLARIGGIAQRFVPDDEILARCLYPLVNEAAALLSDGIAARPGDVDVVWANGYGFPSFRGGPLRWADAVGLPSIVAAMENFERQHGARWAPSPLLRELAAAHETFGAWRPRTNAWT